MDMQEKLKESLGNKIIEWQEKSTKRIYFTIDKKDVFEVCEILFKKLALRFSIASATDTPDGFEVLYHFSFDQAGQFFSARVLIREKDNPSIDSITPIFPGAEWIEREIWELIGINFIGHPNLKRLLLSDDWPDGEYPLRRK